MPTRLARQAVTAAALRGDGPALAHSGMSGYDRRRAEAFRSALAGDRQLALGELGLGGGVRSVRLGLDIAIIELLTRGAAPAVEAVRLALRDGVHGEPDVPLVLAACVRLDPELSRSALGVALSGGTPLERTRAAAAVIGATRVGPVQAAVPAVVAVSLAVAVLAFMRLPGLTDAQEAATPRLQAPRPSVVVAAPPRKAGGDAPAEPEAVGVEAGSIPVRFTPGGSGSGSADGTGSLSGREGSRPATPRPTPNAPPAEGPSSPPPSDPAPSSPSPASSPAPVTSQGSTAARPASAPPAAAPPAEPPRQPASAKPSKAERKAEKAERKADKAEEKAARKAEKGAAAVVSPPVTTQPAGLTSTSAESEATAAPESASAPGDDDERRSKPDKPDKPEKGK